MLVVEDDGEQRTMHLEAAFFSACVMNESQFSKAVHKKADSGPSGADHFRQGLLADLRNYGFRYAFFAKLSEHEEDACQTLFAGIEQLVDQILFVAYIAGQQMGHEHIGKVVLAMEGFHHGLLLDDQQLTVGQSNRGSHAQRLASQRPFAEKILLAQNGDGSFLARLRNDGESDFPLLNVKDGIRGVSLRIDTALPRYTDRLSAPANGPEKECRVEYLPFLDLGGSHSPWIVTLTCPDELEKIGLHSDGKLPVQAGELGMLQSWETHRISYG